MLRPAGCLSPGITACHCCSLPRFCNPAAKHLEMCLCRGIITKIGFNSVHPSEQTRHLGFVLKPVVWDFQDKPVIYLPTLKEALQATEETWAEAKVQFHPVSHPMARTRLRGPCGCLGLSLQVKAVLAKPKGRMAHFEQSPGIQKMSCSCLAPWWPVTG